MKKGHLEKFWNGVHLEEEEKEDLESRNLIVAGVQYDRLAVMHTEITIVDDLQNDHIALNYR